MTARQFDIEALIQGMDFCLERAILRILSFHMGEDNAISRQGLMENLAMHGFDYGTGQMDPRTKRRVFNDRPVRDQINQMRKNSVPICAKSGVGGGYFWPVRWSELDAFIAKELHGKAMDLLEQEKILRQVGEKMWGKYSPAKQASLF
jgi:hypothetical protein